MTRRIHALGTMLGALTLLTPSLLAAQGRGGRGGFNAADSIKYTYPSTPQLEKLKDDAAREIDGMSKKIQEMVDMVFSFGEPGFQEFETVKYLTGILEQNGFKVQRGVAGIPTAFVATWGSGKPVISLGSDIDDIPQASNKPGVGWHDPIVEGAPGHGEGHNSGEPLNIAAALAVKKIMERDHIAGTIQIWDGVAEELMSGKAWLVRAGVFKDVDVTLFTHVGNDLGVSWGQSGSNALISALFKFKGQAAHAAGAPWRGKSALDAAMLMGMSWEFQREHMDLPQRSHYVIPDGGDQPNVVPSTASIWFYFRHLDFDRTMAMFDDAKKKATAAAMMTGTQVDTIMMLGSGWSGHFSRPIAEAMYQNIKKVGMPTWDDKDQLLAKGIQRELGQRENGLQTTGGRLAGPALEAMRTGGGSDDIGDVSWVVPTITLNYPSNIPGLPGHHWANAISMATPIAHKGVAAGAKVQAMTMLDILLTPQVVTDAWDYFRTVQTKDIKYKPFFAATDQPPIWLNKERMEKYRPLMQKYYYDPKKYPTYLDQLGIKYPTVRNIVP
ncbi:MAG TPA: amidohydrolase [Gemmatimonadaceae bacterium]|nr:amidohydrolase [Gemmatimonadaceae bacterium]